MQTEQVDHEFRPEILSRRGELFAWVCALIVLIAILVLKWTGQHVPLTLSILIIFLCFSGVIISLNNWIDRRTVIRLGPEGIEFEDGLRKARLLWDEIQQVQVIPSTWGKKVQVKGAYSFFSYKTFGEMKYQGEVRGRTGFKEGDKILEQILEAAHLQKTGQAGEIILYERS